MKHLFRMRTAIAMIFALSALAFLPSCYNDDDLWDSVDDLDNRVTDIESQLKSINSDIATLHALIDGVQQGAVITACTRTEDGWKVTLSDGQVIDLHNGRDGIAGVDGKDAPVVGVREDADGVYYWTMTIGGTTDWIMGSKGEKLPVSGSDGAAGAAGQTPRLGVLDGFWTVDYGDGKGAVFMRDSDGNKVAVTTESQTPSIFKEINVNDDDVTFRMTDGTEFSLVRIDNFGLSMDTSDPLFQAGQTRVYELTLTGVSDFYITTVTEGWTARIKGETLEVTAPAEVGEDNANCDVRLVVVNKRHDMRAFKLSVRVSLMVERVLTFEDEDYKGTGNMLGKMDWSSLVDEKQYGGSLLYPTDDVLYHWSDEGNTWLAAELTNSYGDYQFWGGGQAISNYCDTDLSNGNFMNQLSVYYQHSNGNGGHNGSKNFGVQNGYFDTDPNGLAHDRKLPALYFTGGKTGVIKEMWVMNTTYVANSWILGDGFAPVAGPDDWFKVVAYAFDADGNLIDKHPELMLAQGSSILTEWTRWDLSELGEVSKIAFNLESTISNAYGMSTPAYFAYDDIKVLVQAN